jgi:EAL domain-containing protein (putative c-di-GMP-specific phosphodiesterase class I)
LRTVAEGIEEQGELDVMREIGCDAGQGYLFQRPVPAAEFADFLHEWPQRRHGFGFPHGLRLHARDSLRDIA